VDYNGEHRDNRRFKTGVSGAVPSQPRHSLGNTGRVGRQDKASLFAALPAAPLLFVGNQSFSC